MMIPALVTACYQRKYLSAPQIFLFRGRREESLPIFKRRILGSLLDFAARELQDHIEVIVAATVECSSPRNATAGAKNVAQLSVVLVENAIVILMLVEDHLRLQRKLCSGKTTLTLHIIAVAQKVEENVMFLEAEHTFDAAYSKPLGGDVEHLIICQPDKEEMALELANSLCRSGAIHQICVYSVLALTPHAEIEGEIWMQQMDLQTQLVSQALCKISRNASKVGCTLIFLHQIRRKIDVSYGNAEVTSEGIALKFLASLRLEIQLIEKDNSVNGNEDSGLHERARPYKPAEFAIIFGAGVNKPGCIFTCIEVMDVVARKRSWNSYRNPLYGEIEKVVLSLMLVGIGQVSSSYAGHLSQALQHQEHDLIEEEIPTAIRLP
ncbi:hypothetical protein Nepgr_032915 [Nepenthes gracilis]|uniref:RecA family profile 2 domain-containing protein n=1 Tax=Nepenthes gracilis TaxID=150966 RepID=A0AAD3TKC7_NEPGR|nr:hypothetical protein Nepgr_032915 [Nepenthes gracilis]